MKKQEPLQLRPVTNAEAAELVCRERRATPWPWTQVSLEQSIRSGHLCRTAWADKDNVGYCVLLDNSGALEILNLVVFAEYQRRGYGRQLLKAIHRQAAVRGLTEIWLEVREDNEPAIALYRSDGFIEQGRRTGYYKTDDGSADTAKAINAILMCRHLLLEDWQGGAD